MKTKFKIILIYCVLLLLASAIIASGSYIYSKTAPTQEEVRAARLAELKADLLKAAQTGSEPQQTSRVIKRKPARTSSRSGST